MKSAVLIGFLIAFAFAASVYSVVTFVGLDLIGGLGLSFREIVGIAVVLTVVGSNVSTSQR